MRRKPGTLARAIRTPVGYVVRALMILQMGILVSSYAPCLGPFGALEKSLLAPDFHTSGSANFDDVIHAFLFSLADAMPSPLGSMAGTCNSSQAGCWFGMCQRRSAGRETRPEAQKKFVRRFAAYCERIGVGIQAILPAESSGGDRSDGLFHRAHCEMFRQSTTTSRNALLHGQRTPYTENGVSVQF
jgi:hypothetical protein